jgi:NADPH:quinone reductase-like Zn-dependent oxidoreductase
MTIGDALGRCRPLFRRSVLVVDPSAGTGREALELARSEGARVTVLCPPLQAPEARDAGADFVLDPTRTDPTWYRGAWAVIVDPAGALGYRRARRALEGGGAYVTFRARPLERALALVDRIGGPRRLLRLRG